MLEKGGVIKVPTGPGIGLNPVERRIREATLKSEVFKPFSPEFACQYFSYPIKYIYSVED